MRRKPVTDITAWPSLTLEGNLIAPAMVARIDRREAPEQSEESYGIRKGLTLREEISTAFRVGQSHFDSFARAQNPSAEATRRFVRDFLRETFGFHDLSAGEAPVAFIAGNRVAVVVVPRAEDIDRRSPTLSVDRARSAVFALQDHLNEGDEALWGIVTNGAKLRLMRDNASLTRPAYIEADLAQIFATEDAASFAALWLMIHRTRFGVAGAPAADCALERWRDAGGREGEAARDRLAGQVEEALRALGTGFLDANPDLAIRIWSGALPLTDWFNELLRLVYRLIFLMVAEDRDLLHPRDADGNARKLYADGYGLGVLRAQSVRRAAWDRHHDRFEGLKIVFRALTKGEPALALPALGGLFAADRLPNLEAATLCNRALMEAVYRLSWLADRSGLVPVNWRAMETEELGSVYESLLELQPMLSDDGRALRFAAESAEARGNQRKTTGSYYTPDSLVQALLDTALDPVLDRAEAESGDAAEALLSLSIIDPACGSGHFLLAAARRMATRVARLRADGTPSAEDFRHALRDVARCCLYGVDRNPMAVELTQVALWIETVDPGLPLGFFDAQVRCGDSLLGIFDLKALEQGIPDAAYKPLAGDDKETAKHFAKRNKSEKSGQGMLDFVHGGGTLPTARQLADLGGHLRAMPETTLAEREARAAEYRALHGRTDWLGWKTACDAYVAAFIAPKRGGVPANHQTVTIPTTAHVWDAMAGQRLYGPLAARVDELAFKARAFHWPLEFPDIMDGGGFDVVLGNPPWERIKLQEQEFFAARSPEIAAAPNKAAREKLIKALSAKDADDGQHALFAAFEEAKRTAEASSEFARVPGDDGGRFRLTGCGDVNTYALFAELFSDLAGPKGRAGVIVPTGIATDATTAPFFADLVEKKRLARLVDFENRDLIFPHVYYRVKFCLLTLGQNVPEAHFAFFLTDPAQLDEPARSFPLSPDQITAINPNTRTAPVFRSKADADLIAKIYANAPVLVEESKCAAGNPWGVGFARLFDMSNDSGLFRTARQLAEAGLVRDGADWVSSVACPRQQALALDETATGFLDLVGGGVPPSRRYVPLYEAKLTSYYDHRASGYKTRGDERGFRILPETTLEERQNPDYDPEPFYWVDQAELDRRLLEKTRRDWLMGWKDVTSVTNERTAIFCIIPRVAVGHTMPLLFTAQACTRDLGLYANVNSLVFDFVAKSKVAGLHLTYGYLKQLPIIPPSFYTEARLSFVVPKVLELTYTSHSMTPFARDLGYDGRPFRWDDDRRALLRADLDAFYARAYGLDRDELRYILDPADVKGPDYPSETFRVLKEKEIRQFTKYRTKDLVLRAWDRMNADGTFARLGFGADQATDQVASIIQRPAPMELSDEVWARAVQQPGDAGAALAAILKAINGPVPSRTIRLAAAMMLEPHLLTALLPDRQAREWRRLVGREAEPRAGNVIGFAARTTPGWGVAVSSHRGNGRLIEHLSAGTWAPGLGLERIETSGWPDGRAGFVLTALDSLNLDTTVTSLPDEVRDWITHVAAA